MTTLEAFEAELRQYCNFKVAFKDESPLMGVLGFCLRPLNPAFMQDTATTLGSTVWFPSRQYYEAFGEGMLAHEFVHLWDKADNPWWFGLSYLMPQVLIAPILVLAGVLSFMGAPWLSLALAPLALACFFLPSPWRVAWELRGYAATLAHAYWTEGYGISVSTLVKWFTSWSYCRMSQDPAQVELEILNLQSRINAGELQKHGPYRVLYEFFRREGRLVG
jgi:hypothetical protein